MGHGRDNTHVVLLEEVLAQSSGHEHPAGVRVRTEVCLAALTPRGRLVRVELHCAPAEQTNGAARKVDESKVCSEWDGTRRVLELRE